MVGIRKLVALALGTVTAVYSLTPLAFNPLDGAIGSLEQPGRLQDVRPSLVLESFDGADYLYKPSGLAFASDGGLYIFDSGNDRIVTFSADGTFVRSFGRSGDAPGEFRTNRGNYEDDIAIEGNFVLVLEALRRRVQIFDLSGEYLTGFTQSNIATTGVAMKGADVYLGIMAIGAGASTMIISDVDGNVSKEFGEATLGGPRRILDLVHFDIGASGRVFQAFYLFPLLRIMDGDSQIDRWYDFSWWGDSAPTAEYTQFDQTAFEELREEYAKGLVVRGSPNEPDWPHRIVFADVGCARRTPVCALLLMKGIVQIIAEDGAPLDSYRLLPPGEPRRHDPVAIAVTDDGERFCVADWHESLVSCYERVLSS